jgi:3'-phosphoadenosine 5'-phosphosulfate sulfotransferase (PAPS reductase)/FAD synthetase
MTKELPKLLVSFSGGRTSGYMTKKILDSMRDKFEICVVFANTGEENEETLRFVDKCDVNFGFGTVWVEAVAHQGERKSSTHRVVNFKSASRNGEPFEGMIQKYGIPNMGAPHCTRELKLHAIRSYMREIGWGKYATAIGIRVDELRRVNEAQVKKFDIVYPLIDWFAADKQDVNDWWAQQDFNLELLEHQGNCKWCWKKSIKKHSMILAESPEFFDFPQSMEAKYGFVGPEFKKETEKPFTARVFFRGNRSTLALKTICSEANAQVIKQMKIDFDANSGCSESCELYDMEAA